MSLFSGHSIERRIVVFWDIRISWSQELLQLRLDQPIVSLASFFIQYFFVNPQRLASFILQWLQFWKITEKSRVWKRA
jgi:hypothetical protein